MKKKELKITKNIANFLSICLKMHIINEDVRASNLKKHINHTEIGRCAKILRKFGIIEYDTYNLIKTKENIDHVNKLLKDYDKRFNEGHRNVVEALNLVTKYATTVIISIIVIGSLGFIILYVDGGLTGYVIRNEAPRYYIMENSICVRIDATKDITNKTIYADDKCSEIYEPVFYPNLSIKR